MDRTTKTVLNLAKLSKIKRKSVKVKPDWSELAKHGIVRTGPKTKLTVCQCSICKLGISCGDKVN